MLYLSSFNALFDTVSIHCFDSYLKNIPKLCEDLISPSPLKNKQKYYDYIVGVSMLRTAFLSCFIRVTCFCFRLKSLSFPSIKVKLYPTILLYSANRPVKRYAGQNEVRFKVTDKKMEIYRETAFYLYDHMQQQPHPLSYPGYYTSDQTFPL
jgi:hypothetical protein